MPKAKQQTAADALFGKTQIGKLSKSEPKYVKVVVFDDQDRVLMIKNADRFALPGGRVEWGDDDAEAAARREVLETTKVCIGPMAPVTILTQEGGPFISAQTIVYVGRVAEKQASALHPEAPPCFVSMKSFLGKNGPPQSLYARIIRAAKRALMSEEIKEEHNEETQYGKEKYRLYSIH